MERCCLATKEITQFENSNKYSFVGENDTLILVTINIIINIEQLFIFVAFNAFVFPLYDANKLLLTEYRLPFGLNDGGFCNVWPLAHWHFGTLATIIFSKFQCISIISEKPNQNLQPYAK